MRTSIKKTLSLVLIALLVITTTPAMSFAEADFSISVDASTVTSNSAIVTLNNTTPGATYTAELNFNGDFDPATNTLTGLQANKDYTLTITERSNETTTRFEVKCEGDFFNPKYYYMDNGIKNYVKWRDIYYYIFGYKTPGYSIITANYTDVHKAITKSASTTFKTKGLPKLTLNVGHGGIAIIDGIIYEPGTYPLYKNTNPKSFSGKSYSNAGFTGGSNLGFYFEATGHATWNINFTHLAKVYGNPYYDHDGFFSGLKASGVDIHEQDPMNDALSATFTADPNQYTYTLGQQADIALNINTIDGDSDTCRLNEVDIFLNNDGSNDLLVETDSIEDNKTLTYSYTIPATVDELTDFTKGPVVEGKTLYTKEMNFDLVDRYAGTAGAAIINSSTCTIIVEVPLPVHTVTFNAEGGSPEPEDVEITCGCQVEAPADPAKEGYTFDYWTLNGIEYDFNAAVTESICLVAHYTAIEQEQQTTDPEPSTETPTQSNPEPSTETPTQSNSEPSTETPTQSNPPVQPQGPTGTVQIVYVDELGNPLSSAFQFSGEIGTNYSTSSKSIDGYTLIESPANASGSFIEGTTVVSYVYSTGLVVVEDEEVALGESNVLNFDVILPSEAPSIELVNEEIVIDEPTPLADALPQTGQIPVEYFYGIGGLITAAGVFLKRKNESKN